MEFNEKVSKITELKNTIDNIDQYISELKSYKDLHLTGNLMVEKAETDYYDKSYVFKETRTYDLLLPKPLTEEDFKNIIISGLEKKKIEFYNNIKLLLEDK